MLADEETPISLYLRFAQFPGSFLLESAEGGERLGRHSFLGFQPLMRLTCREGTVVLEGQGERRALPGAPWQAVRDVIESIEAPGVDGEGFQGGFVGYFGYDMARYSEPLPMRPTDDRALADLDLMMPQLLLGYDHLTRVLSLKAFAFVDDEGEQAARQKARRILGEALSLLQRPYSAHPVQAAAETDVVPLVGRSRFVRRVERAQAYITAGDIFQVVLSERLEALFHGTPLDVYRRLRMLNPSPYLFFLNFDEQSQMIGSSPEMLVKVELGAVSTRPIAGTRPRGTSVDEDERLRAELLSDSKERAEHVMLVDLGRNDVGRVSTPGSVAVRELMTTERYSHVWHLVSEVQGRLAEDRSPLAALEACFPAGTLSGAPKVRAMQIIDELESVARGPYGGAVGYVGFNGALDTCIAIRTVVLQGGMAYLQAGAGIVADSVPDREYEECLHKARALIAALGGVGGQAG